ncbi:MAG: hypothetical protein H7096_08345 [Flavobacterium sp.]|nr:hypothetical protein [Pedobacter sp.]
MVENVFSILLLLFGLSSYAQQQEPIKTDGLQFKEFFFEMLKRDPNRYQDLLTVQKRCARHMANIRTMTCGGKIVVAGPFNNWSNWRGIFIFKTKMMDDAKSLVINDPMIITGWLNHDIHPRWTMKGAKFS